MVRGTIGSRGVSTYALLTNVTAVQAAPTATRPPNNPAIAPGPNNANMPPQSQQFQLEVSGIGAVSATVQLVGSNDVGSVKNWYNYGDPLTATGTDLGQKATTLAAPWREIGAYVTAISGTNASASVRMSA